MNKDQTQVFIVSISTRRARGDVFDALDSPFSIFTSITVNTHGSDPSFIRARPAGARPPLHTSVRPFSSRMRFRHARARGVVASRERTRARRARIKSHRRVDARSLASARRARRRVASRASGARHGARRAGTSTSSHHAARARVDRRPRRARCRARVRIKWRTHAVAVGRKTGVYTTWDDAKRQVDAGGAKHKARSRAPRRALASRARRAIGDRRRVFFFQSSQKFTSSTRRRRSLREHEGDAGRAGGATVDDDGKGGNASSSRAQMSGVARDARIGTNETTFSTTVSLASGASASRARGASTEAGGGGEAADGRRRRRRPLGG